MAVAPRLGCPIPSEPTMGNLFVYWARGACITPLSCASPYANVSGYHPCLASVKKHCREIYAGRRQNHHVSCPRRPARLHHRQVPRLSSLSKCLCAQPRFDRGSDMYCAPLPHPLKSQPPPNYGGRPFDHCLAGPQNLPASLGPYTPVGQPTRVVLDRTVSMAALN